MVSKGAETRERILESAMGLARRDGLAGLTIGGLATATGLSKSGLFAHFGSKEDLQLEVLTAAVNRFTDEVMRPAFKAPRGLPRLRKLFDLKLEWMNMPGGCPITAAAVELDDREGRLREYLVEIERQFVVSMGRTVELAVNAGHFRPDVDPEQFSFELNSILMGYHHARRLLRWPHAEARARAAFERLIEDAKVR